MIPQSWRGKTARKIVRWKQAETKQTTTGQDPNETKEGEDIKGKDDTKKVEEGKEEDKKESNPTECVALVQHSGAEVWEGSEADCDKKRAKKNEDQEKKAKKSEGLEKKAKKSEGLEKKETKKSEDQEKEKAKKSEEHNKCGKGKKSERRLKNKKAAPAATTSECESTDSEIEVTPPPKKRRRCVRRNLTIFPGQNYVCSSTDPNVVKLHNDYDVFVKKVELDRALLASTPTKFVQQIVDKVYTKEAIEGSTPKGFPPRGKGRSATYKHDVVPPRLHPDGISAIMRSVLDRQEEKKSPWCHCKSNEQYLLQTLSSRVWQMKND